MTQKHNMNFTTKWELINPEGKIVEKGGDKTPPQCEGTVSWKVYNRRKELVDEGEQPMGSFVAGFIEDCIVAGYRIAKRNESYSSLPNSIGHCRSDSKVYVQNIGLIYPHNTFSNTSWTSSAVSSTSAGFVLESLTEQNNSIKAVISCERDIISGAGGITECTLYSEHYPRFATPPVSDDYKQGMIARDVFSTPINFISSGFVRIKYTLNFPCDSDKTVTMNFVKNLLQNIVTTDYNDFIKTDGTLVSGIGASTNITTQTFTKKDNVIGAANDDTMGIVIGTSNAPIDCNDSNLAAPINNGANANQMLYEAMSTVSDIATIFPSQGKAKVFYSRTFINNSGNSITVREAGLVAKVADVDSSSQGISTGGSYLLARWLTQDVVVPDRYILKIYFMPEVRATAEDLDSVDTNDIIIVSDEMRNLHPSLKKISMITKAAISKNWLSAVSYVGETCTLGGFSDWRLPVQRNLNSYDVPENELKGIWTVYYDQISGWDTSMWSGNQNENNEIYTVTGTGIITRDRKQYTYKMICVR